MDGFTRFLASVASSTFNKPLPEYSGWDSIVPLTQRDLDNDTSLEKPYIFTTEQGELITFFDLQGVFQIVGKDHFAEMLNELCMSLRPLCNKYGIDFWISYEEDPDRAYDELARIVAPQIMASRRMGLKVEDIIRSRISKNASRCHFEQNFLVMKTGLLALAKETMKEEMGEKARKRKALKSNLIPKYGQDLDTIYESLRTLHITNVERVIENFRLCDKSGTSGIMLRRIDVHEAARGVRIMLERERTSQNWVPKLITDGPTPRGHLKHIDDFIPTKLKWQICVSNPSIIEGTPYIDTGEFAHANMHMELAPQEIRQFSELLQNMDRTMPFRCTFHLCPRGLDSCKLRDFTTQLVGFFGQPKKVKQALDYLKETDEHDPVMAMQFNVSTWARDTETLKRRVSTLDSAIQGWGVCSMSGATGDPVAYWTATVPGFSKGNPSTVMTPPLREAAEMLPLARPASPFINGWLPMCTPDGKIIPLHSYSDLQDTWIRISSGTPGSGKSLKMNVTNFAFAVAPGYSSLPLMLMLDVGKSSFGTIYLIKDELPEHRKNEVMAIELENSREYCTNIFDTQLGLRQPLAHEREFINNFIKRLCAQRKTSEEGVTSLQIPEGVEGFVSQLVDMAYKATENAESQFHYEPGRDHKVDTALAEIRQTSERDERWWEVVTWWEVVDMLFDAGHPQLAASAQRFAVPEFTMLSSIAASEQLSNLYPELRVNETGESIQQYVIRHLRDVATTFPMFAGRTRFEISSETRILSVELGKVLATKKEHAGLFYMLARHLGTRSFFLDTETFMPYCPDRYKAHHEARILANRAEKRMIAADETHNFSDDPFTSNQFVVDGRQGRKLGLVIELVSQYLKDHHPLIREAATDVFVLRGGSSSDEKILQEEFKVTPETIIRLRRECRGPGPNGANFLAFFKTQLGNVCHILNNTASATELWAFSTSQKDTIIRDELYKRFGTDVARSHLVKRFPSGSSASYQERIKERGLNQENQTVAGYLIEELSKEIREGA